jgi:hypothetical protein
MLLSQPLSRPAPACLSSSLAAHSLRDELKATIESCRKFILAGRIAVASGSAVLITILVGAIQFDPSVMGVAAAAVLGGIVAVGSNRSTAKEALRELTALEAEQATLIGQLDLRIVPNRDR